MDINSRINGFELVNYSVPFVRIWVCTWFIYTYSLIKSSYKVRYSNALYRLCGGVILPHKVCALNTQPALSDLSVVHKTDMKILFYKLGVNLCLLVANFLIVTMENYSKIFYAAPMRRRWTMQITAFFVSANIFWITWEQKYDSAPCNSRIITWNRKHIRENQDSPSQRFLQQSKSLIFKTMTCECDFKLNLHRGTQLAGALYF